MAKFDYAKGRATAITYSDCVVLVNRSPAEIKHIVVTFGAVDPNGKPRRPNLSFDVRRNLKPGETSSGDSNCMPDGYANGDRGLWLVAWISEVDFDDGTAWHAPPREEVLAEIVSTLGAYNANH